MGRGIIVRRCSRMFSRLCAWLAQWSSRMNEMVRPGHVTRWYVKRASDIHDTIHICVASLYSRYDSCVYLMVVWLISPVLFHDHWGNSPPVQLADAFNSGDCSNQFPFFVSISPAIFLMLGIFMSDHRYNLCCTFSDAKRNNHNFIKYITRYIDPFET